MPGIYYITEEDGFSGVNKRNRFERQYIINDLAKAEGQDYKELKRGLYGLCHIGDIREMSLSTLKNVLNLSGLDLSNERINLKELLDCPDGKFYDHTGTISEDPTEVIHTAVTYIDCTGVIGITLEELQKYNKNVIYDGIKPMGKHEAEELKRREAKKLESMPSVVCCVM